jgi:CRP/FNR family transcriptional regulator, anaerobic regulatory protein
MRDTGDFGRSPCGDCPLTALGAHGEPDLRTVPVGAAIFDQGDPAVALFQVQSGLVLESTSNVSGVETQCAIRGPGSTLGIQALSGGTQGSDALALTPVVVCRIVAQRMLDGIDECSPCFSLVRLALEESEFWRGQQLLGGGSAPVRVARLLVALARHCGDQPPQLARGLMARAARIRPETLSRALSRLREEGFIAGDASLRIVDMDGLLAFANGA